MLKTHKLVDGELFCWVVRDSYTGNMVVYVDHAGNYSGRFRPSIRYSAKGLRELYPGCKYYTPLGKSVVYDISELSTEELQKLFEKEAV